MRIGDNENDEKTLFLPRPQREVSLEEKANAYLRLAVIHKISIPDKWERVLSKEKAKKELENHDPLNEWKDIEGLENKIQESKDTIHRLSKKIRMFEKSEGENKEKERLNAEKKSRQKKLKMLEKFLDDNNPRIEDAIKKTKQDIEELEMQIIAFEKNGYKEKIRLEEEMEGVKTKLKIFDNFGKKIHDIVSWQRALWESKKAILNSWAFEQDSKKLDWIIKFHASLKEIETQ